MDSLQMKRVLVNLLDNALEALTGEPVQELNLRCELARDENDGAAYDFGYRRGIASEDRERLFTPYFSTRKKRHGARPCDLKPDCCGPWRLHWSGAEFAESTRCSRIT